jgi:hypothetical protein
LSGDFFDAGVLNRPGFLAYVACALGCFWLAFAKRVRSKETVHGFEAFKAEEAFKDLPNRRESDSR